MYVRHLQVNDFRSWEHADLELEPGPSVLVGSNGQGKTNLVEALGYAATLGSHRVATDAPLIRHGCQRAIVRTAVVNEGRELMIELTEEVCPRGGCDFAVDMAQNAARLPDIAMNLQYQYIAANSYPLAGGNSQITSALGQPSPRNATTSMS